MKPPPKQPPFDPKALADEIIGLLVRRYPVTTAVQWTITCTWSTAHPAMHRAEAYHPGKFVVPVTATAKGSRSALEQLLADVRRG